MISKSELMDLLRSRILILDGAMGTMIQHRGLGGGNNEALNLTHPEVITDIHRAYIAAGADIISTNSFNANALSQAAYGSSSSAPHLALTSAHLARLAADSFPSAPSSDVPPSGNPSLNSSGSAPANVLSAPERLADFLNSSGSAPANGRSAPERPRRILVAGSVGPTGKSLSLPCDAADPAARPVDFDTLCAAYREQIAALIEGGADFILVETCFDALNAKAALYASTLVSASLSSAPSSGTAFPNSPWSAPANVRNTPERLAAFPNSPGSAPANVRNTPERLADFPNSPGSAPADGRSATERDVVIPVVVSATVSDRSYRTITGQTLRSFYEAISGFDCLCAFGVNCALGASEMMPLVREIARFSSHPVIFYPNAGIPDEMGNYNDTPSSFASCLAELAAEGCLNIAGGCCGTTDAHISALAAALSTAPSHPFTAHPAPSSAPSPGSAPADVHNTPERLADFPTSSGSAPADVRSATERDEVLGEKSVATALLMVGERANVAGSAKFRKLVEAGDFEACVEIAAAQVEAGAQIIDINLDDPLGDPQVLMRTFLRHFSCEPAVSGVPVMIDSSRWDTLVEGLKNVQVKAIVNSISLKEGEEEFLRRAREIHALGASMVVMAFDETGQAETYERKIEICRRSYDLLVGAGIPSSEIIFDCNILTVATGIPEHARFGVDFIEAVRWIKANLPGARTSGGLSNLSFAFRGNNPVREAMHSVFLYHAVRAGLDMAIVNPSALMPYECVQPDLRRAIEDVLFDSDPDATSRLLELASASVAGSASAGSVSAGSASASAGSASASASVGAQSSGSATADVRNAPERVGGMGGNTSSGMTDGAAVISVEERLINALVKGGSATLEEDVMEALRGFDGEAVAVVEGPLLKGMERVGELFAAGKMFLPQVVRSAKVMRDAVAVLQPYMESASESENSDASTSPAEPSNVQSSGSATADVRSTAERDGGRRRVRPRFLIATVQGDVHDIGKNITATVLQCSGFEVIDLGVMVPNEEILAKAVELGVDAIGVSGLITPSLYRMEELCREMSVRGMTLPLFVGGAATSARHTDLKLKPLYDNVHYGSDASATAALAGKIVRANAEEASRSGALRTSAGALQGEMGKDARSFGSAADICRSTAERVGANAAEDASRSGALRTFAGALQGEMEKDASRSGALRTSAGALPGEVGDGVVELSAEGVKECFDWRMFFAVCGVKVGQISATTSGTANAIGTVAASGTENGTANASGNAKATINASDGVRGDGVESYLGQLKEQAERVLDSGEVSVRAAVRFFDCVRRGDDFVLEVNHSEGCTCCSKRGRILPMLRGKMVGNPDAQCSLTDFYIENKHSRLGLFALRVCDSSRNDAAGQTDLVRHAIRATLAEAASTYIGKILDGCSVNDGGNNIAVSLRSELGTECSGVLMPAVGYACCPDHSLKRDILAMLPSSLDISLTDSCAMIPEESICGLIIPVYNGPSKPAFRDIRSITPAQADEYALRRSFTQKQKALFLGHLIESAALK